MGSRRSFKPGNMLNPVPVVMVSCADAAGRANIITVAWTGTVCSDPPMLSVSIRPDRYSHHMIEETGEFVVNLVTEKLVRACDYCGVTSGRDVDKFIETRLTPADMEHVAVPGIAESPVCIGCKVVRKETLGSHDIFLAEIVEVSADEAYMDEAGRFMINESGLVMYSHGEYFAMGEKLGKFGYSIRKSGH
ncbi:MAG: flavin reductase family protein [Clostridiales bacterium]|nr:flavin reductase family protein [Clostridiales bacterium]